MKERHGHFCLSSETLGILGTILVAITNHNFHYEIDWETLDKAVLYMWSEFHYVWCSCPFSQTLWHCCVLTWYCGSVWPQIQSADSSSCFSFLLFRVLLSVYLEALDIELKIGYFTCDGHFDWILYFALIALIGHFICIKNMNEPANVCFLALLLCSCLHLQRFLI